MKNFTLFLLILVSTASRAQWTCGDTLVDPRDGKMYLTVPIGSDCWMAQNLNYGQYTASNITASPHSDVFNDSVVQKYGQNNDSNNCSIYGGLYEWNEMMNYNSSDIHGICPPGWHVATDAEWQAMIIASGGTFSGNRGTGANDLKAIGEGLGADTGTNASGFAARAGGDRDAFGIFYGMDLRFIFWTSTSSPFMPYQYTLWAENDSIYRYDDAGTESGFSCRCVKDGPAGIEETPRKQTFNIAPNPAFGSIEIQRTDNESMVPYNIFNAQGQPVLSGVLENNRQQVNVASLPAGYYTFSLTVNGVVSNQQLIITE